MRLLSAALLVSLSLTAGRAMVLPGDDTTPPAPAPSAALFAPLSVPATAASARAGKSASIFAPSMRPFSAFGADIKSGTNGIGFDVATPLGLDFNLRGSASFFNLDPSIDADGIQTEATIHLGSAGFALDYYPWGGRFRISPGLLLYDNDHVSGTSLVPGGSAFTLGNNDYTSSPANPVHGNSFLDIGAKAAPTITFGFGNLIPRSGNHWSVPFEAGFAYIRQPSMVFNLVGTVCNKQGCDNLATDASAQADLKQEQRDINADLSGLRFFPILSIGAGYRF